MCIPNWVTSCPRPGMCQSQREIEAIHQDAPCAACRGCGQGVPEMSLGRWGCSTATDLQPPLLAEDSLRRTWNSLCFLSREEAAQLFLW